MADDRNLNDYDDLDRRPRDDDASDDAPRIAALSDLDDFQIAEGFPDPRGWDVMTSDRRKVGTVHDLIVDTDAMRTRYLDVKLDKDAVGTSDDHDVLLPVGAAQLDDDNDCVMLGAMTERQLASLPAFEHGEITREYESSLIGRMPGGAVGDTARGASAAAAGAGFYTGEHFDDSRFYGTRRPDARSDQARVVTRSEEELEVGKRKVQAGEVDIHKHVETEHVSQPVSLRHEEVTIERRPVSGDRAAADIGSADEIRVPITREEAVIEKRPVVKEELVVKKRMVADTKNVEADLRREKIDVDRNVNRDDDRTSSSR